MTRWLAYMISERSCVIQMKVPVKSALLVLSVPKPSKTRVPPWLRSKVAMRLVGEVDAQFSVLAGYRRYRMMKIAARAINADKPMRVQRSGLS